MSSGNDGNDDEGKKGAPPENFYDEELEEKQELMDMATALADGGLHKLSGANAGKNAMTQEDWVTAQEEAPDLQGAIKDGEENEQVPWMDLEDPKNRYAIGHVRRHGTDAELAKHLKSYSPKLDVVPPEQLNYNVAWRKDNVPEENELNDFLPATSTDRFRFDKQGLRHCKGKNQRMGKSGELRCHLIDLDDLSHMDLVTMRRFLSEDAEILGRKHTGLCAKCQVSLRCFIYPSDVSHCLICLDSLLLSSLISLAASLTCPPALHITSHSAPWQKRSKERATWVLCRIWASTCCWIPTPPREALAGSITRRCPPTQTRSLTSRGQLLV
jgi:ribosomal protein S18